MSASSNNDMLASITASLEKSLQKCSLNHHHQATANSSSDSPGNPSNFSDAAAALDLNSQISLPYHWEQCLDLKSGEIYYINWRTGMKAREDPRTIPEDRLTTGSTDLYYTGEEEEEAAAEEDDEDIGDDNDDDSSSSSSSSYDNDGEQGKLKSSSSSSSAAGASSSMTEQLNHRDDDDEDDGVNDHRHRHRHRHQVLVVAGCKVCLMYFMVPKQVQLCPKCTSAQLLHFL